MTAPASHPFDPDPVRLGRCRRCNCHADHAAHAAAPVIRRCRCGADTLHAITVCLACLLRWNGTPAPAETARGS